MIFEAMNLRCAGAHGSRQAGHCLRGVRLGRAGGTGQGYAAGIQADPHQHHAHHLRQKDMIVFSCVRKRQHFQLRRARCRPARSHKNPARFPIDSAHIAAPAEANSPVRCPGPHCCRIRRRRGQLEPCGANGVGCVVYLLG
jgi:hypothetical protein